MLTGCLRLRGITLSCLAWIAAASTASGPTDTFDALPNGCHLSGKFRQSKSIAGLHQPLISEGEFLYSCNAGLIWHTRAPIMESLIYGLEKPPAKLTDGVAIEVLDNRVHRQLGRLLNSLIGGDDGYLHKTFDARKRDKLLVLAPKKKRMQKFISAIDLTRQAQEAHITLHQAGRQQTAIHIFATAEHPSLNARDCSRVLSDQARACEHLFR